MKPLKLKISGLNSFIETQEIDFKTLTDRGLFGIFGPTGSGKSTILDAITLSMYGKVARSTKGEFINTQSKITAVSYEFEIGLGDGRRRYIIDRNIKRDLRTGGYKTSVARIREVISDNEENIIAEGDRDVQRKIAEIIGLTSEDFTRSVVLPQGKFSEFLKLTGQDRRNMLERIFGLSKYGNKLTKKIRDKKNIKYRELNLIIGELNRYEGVSEKALGEISAKLEKLLEEDKSLKEEKNTLNKKYEKLKILWDKQQELNGYTAKKQLLEEKQISIQKKREKVKKAVSANGVKPLIDNVNETRGKIESNKKEIRENTTKLEEIQNLLLKAEKDYTEAFNKKEDKLPEIFAKEADLKQAINILNEVNELKKEKKELLNAYKINEEEIEKNKGLLNKLKESIGQDRQKLNEIEKRIEELKISPEFREKLLEAFDTAREYERILKEKLDKEVKLKALKEETEKEEKKYEEKFSLMLKNEAKLRELEEALANAEKNEPGNGDILLSMQQKLENVKKTYSEAAEENKKIEEVKESLRKIVNLKENIQQNIDKLKEDISYKNESLEKVKKEIDEMKRVNMAKELAKGLEEGMPCPVCGSIHHVKLPDDYEDSYISEKLIMEEKLNEEMQKLRESLLKEQETLAGYKAKEEVYKENLSSFKEKFKDFNIEDYKLYMDKLQFEFINLKEKIEEWNKQKADLQSTIKKFQEEKAELNAEVSGLKQSILKDKAYFDEMQKAIKDIEKQYALLAEKYKKFKEELQVEDIKAKITEVNKNDKELEILQKDYSSIKTALENNLEKEKVLEKSLNDLLIKKAQIVEIGKEKSKYIEEKEKEIKRISEDKDPQEYLDEIEKTKNEIIKAEETLKKVLEDAKQQKSEIENKRNSSIENGKILNKILKEQFFKLEASLLENGFKNEEEVISSFIEKEGIKSLEEEIKSFDNEYAAVCSNINAIFAFLKGERIEEKEWLDLLKKIKDIEDEINQKASEIGEAKKELKDMEMGLEIVKELTKQKQELDADIDMLEDLDKLLQGNRFVEFVATHQLKYIALSASKRLKEITKGRYALEIDSSGNFVMRDDFNGGIRRSSDTLSGGEMFLTSLSLALALSAHIQLKGKAPLEFFFLDEGFGTLDSELLDIVMTSLEKLQNERMCVGIISHVEELKNRVPVKLIVMPADNAGSGSRVKIEYS